MTAKICNESGIIDCETNNHYDETDYCYDEIEDQKTIRNKSNEPQHTQYEKGTDLNPSSTTDQPQQSESVSACIPVNDGCKLKFNPDNEDRLPNNKLYHRAHRLFELSSIARYIRGNGQPQGKNEGLLVADAPNEGGTMKKRFFALTALLGSIIPSYAMLFGGVAATAILLAATTQKAELPYIQVAMIGNSMQYYNDLPRFLEVISSGHLKQDSCLHGNANFNTILTWGNGMYNIWSNGDARIYNYHHGRIHDFGACTVQQLLFGYDDNLDSRVKDFVHDYDKVVASYDDLVFNESAFDDEVEVTDDDKNDDNSYQPQNMEKVYSDDFSSYFDGSNPCLMNPFYYYYLQNKYAYQYQLSSSAGSTDDYMTTTKKRWDYIVMNDNTRTPARNVSRHESLDVLNTTYIPWILETGAVPVFLATYGYWTPYRDMGGLGSIPEFTSLTHEGYLEYARLLEQNLPESQKPRVAPVGIAFLVVWEENYELWKRLFHVDQIHCGPIGTYLEGLIVHYTLFGAMPQYDVAVRPDMSTLFFHSRRFQPGDHRRDPFPTQQEAAYLYNIAIRVMVHKYVPSSFIHYTNGEAVDYDPQDDLYKTDDLF